MGDTPSLLFSDDEEEPDADLEGDRELMVLRLVSQSVSDTLA
jgi:hypothetical protein